MNYIAIKRHDIANGPGIRVSLFVSGCERHCKGCFNPDSWDRQAGIEFTKETLDYLIECLRPDYIRGLSLLGGDPLSSYNRYAVACIVNRIKNEYGDTKDVWLWTGDELANIIKYCGDENNNVYLKSIMKQIDYLVDGPFIEEEKDLSLLWKGSRNQNIIKMADVRKNLLTDL